VNEQSCGPRANHIPAPGLEIAVRVVAAIADNYFKSLCTQLEHAYVPHLPTLIHVGNKSAEDIAKKNLSRSFGAFALASRFDLAPDAAARHVLDDYDDNGIDAFYYDQASATLLLLQSKFKRVRP